MSTRETSAILTAREEITTSLENEEYAEDFYFTGKIHFVGNRVWHEIILTEANILVYGYVDNEKKAHIAADLTEAATFYFS